MTRRTVIAFSQRTFSHLLSLNPKFHTQRNTGSLIRDVERGTSGVGFLLGAGLFTVVPTLVEFAAVLGVMAYGYSLWFTLVIVVTFVVYAALTMGLTQRRELRQRRVNEMDSRANGRLVDTLLNYETVKTYARERFERDRYLAICDQWVVGSIQNQRALSVLHISQSAVIAAGVAAVMLLAGQQTVRGAMTVGDLAAYAAKERPVLCGTYRRHKICSMGPSSSGGTAVLMILKQLERFDMAKLGKDSPVVWHLFAESSRLAYADRDMYLGDPDYIRIPLKGLLDPKYIARRSALISATGSMANVTAGTPPGAARRRSCAPTPVRSSATRRSPGCTSCRPRTAGR